MKLDELQRSGTLTDEEYVKAKAAVVSGDSTSDAHTTPTQLKEHSKIP